MADFDLKKLGYPAFVAQSAKDVVQRVRNGRLKVDDIFGMPLYMPVKLNGEYLPLEPIISVKGKNEIVRSAVNRSKGRGMVKEIFMQHDYELTISGVVMNRPSGNGFTGYGIINREFPETAFKLLRDICESKESVRIECTLASLLNISYISIHDYDFPGNAGSAGRQTYSIKAWSDGGADRGSVYYDLINQLKA